MRPLAPLPIAEPQANQPSTLASLPPAIPALPPTDLDSLAGEILHCYEELHLIYDLSEALTDQLSVSTVAEIILERLLTTFRAAWSELRLHDGSQAAYTRQAGNDARATPQGGAEFELRTILRSGGHDVGAVALRRAGEAFTSGDGKLLDALGTLVGSAIHSAQLYEQLHRQAMYDALTGLPNRVLFHDRLRQGLLAARRGRQPLA